MDGLMDRWTDKKIDDGWMDGQIDGCPCLEVKLSEMDIFKFSS